MKNGQGTITTIITMVIDTDAARAPRHGLRPADLRAAWSVSVTTLLLGIGMLAAGPLSDRWGRTGTIKGSLVLTALLGLACAVAPSWPVLLVLRGAQGLSLPAAVTITAWRFSASARHRQATGHGRRGRSRLGR